ncbi:MAG: ABC transporter ATP-binding protein [Candidatus Thermoplasmatota archaeon]|nr:ABC transporter ATP-binding protein [Candidatus Thermoplasmatota archaeon]|tara:strand:+ start:121 stop:867 length:747 start_codon:yes stop_codon:yes gene_type:complete
MVLENSEGGKLISNAVEISDYYVDYHIFKRSRKKPLGEFNKFCALKNLNLKIPEGQVVALLGRNGAGKSTLLQSIAGLLRPSKGEIRTKGRVILLAGTDPGFIHEMTGRQNVIELALAYGISKLELEEFVNSVETFADIGEAFDRKFSTYSSGMRGKVGFGFITALNPDILLMDETLGVGDREFRAKAAKRLEKLIQRTGTVIISTHSLGLAKDICSRGIILDRGEVFFDSEIEDTVSKYIEMTTKES